MPSNFNTMGPPIIQGLDQFGAALTRGFLERKKTREARAERQQARDIEQARYDAETARKAQEAADRKAAADEKTRQNNMRFMMGRVDDTRKNLMGTAAKQRTSSASPTFKASFGTIPVFLDEKVLDEKGEPRTNDDGTPMFQRRMKTQQELTKEGLSVVEAQKALAEAQGAQFGQAGGTSAPQFQGFQPRTIERFEQEGYALGLTNQDLAFLDQLKVAEQQGQVPAGTAAKATEEVAKGETPEDALAVAIDKADKAASEKMQKTDDAVRGGYTEQDVRQRNYAAIANSPEEAAKFVTSVSRATTKAMDALDAVTPKDASGIDKPVNYDQMVAKNEQRVKDLKGRWGQSQAKKSLAAAKRKQAAYNKSQQTITDLGDTLMLTAAGVEGVPPELEGEFIASISGDMDTVPASDVLRTAARIAKSEGDAAAASTPVPFHNGLNTPQHDAAREAAREAARKQVFDQHLGQYFAMLRARARDFIPVTSPDPSMRGMEGALDAAAAQQAAMQQQALQHATDQRSMMAAPGAPQPMGGFMPQ